MNNRVNAPTKRHIHGSNLPDPYELPLGTTGTCDCGRPVIVLMSEGPWASGVWKIRRWWHRSRQELSCSCGVDEGCNSGWCRGLVADPSVRPRRESTDV